ncbi:MAG: sensor histidine kinase [Anaerolineae bacterium]|nr:sensor histidine kinase [Anaerolineae bacterium]MDW8067403.1 sensor histidine kinase [Anaerolineae bacterium]
MNALLRPMLEFLHGLAFVVLGLFVLFAVPRIGRASIIWPMPLLALFAFGEAVIAWDPVLAAAFGLPTNPTGLPSLLPVGLQAVPVVIAYWALLAASLFVPRAAERSPLLTLPLVVLAFYLGGLVLATLLVGAERVAPWADVAARVGLAFPGGLLALRSRHQPVPPGAPPVFHTAERPLRRVRVAMAAFGLLAGAIQPTLVLLGSRVPSFIFSFLSALLTLCGVAILSGLIGTLHTVQTRVEEWVEEVRQAQALAADRERISRELHDGIIQSIYAAGLMLEGVRAAIPEDPAAAQAQLDRVLRSLNQTIQDIRRYIFDLRGGFPQTDLVSGLEELLRDFRINTLLETRLTVSGEERERLSAEQRQHILQIAREALSNVARHAHARRVDVRLTYDTRTLQLRIADDGVGLAMTPTPTGQGMRNIRERARLLDGTLDIDSAPGQGVTITLTVPLKGEA